MRKFAAIILFILLLATLPVSVSAAGSATGANVVASVASDGSCQVNMTVTIHMDQAEEKVYFPIPRDATAVTLNGSRVSARRSGDVRRVNLRKVMGKVAGDFSFSISYSLRDVIHTDENNIQQLQLPLLSGFAYTIEKMDFTVTLPGNVEAKPAFVSGYHKASIEADLSCTVDGMTVTGTSLKSLKDHETLTMVLEVSDQMFPRSISRIRTPGIFAAAMAVCAVLALVLWLFTMRYLPVRVDRTGVPPEGYCAGTVGCAVALQGADLSMMVLSWAQMGYLQLQRDRRGHVMLLKRMEMGNERGEFEQRCFKKLFGKRSQADTASLNFALLQRELSGRCVQVRELLRGKGIALKLYRLLVAGIGLCGGAGMGMMLSGSTAWKIILVILLGAAGGLTGWYAVNWAGSLMLHRRRSLVTGLAILAAWLLFSLLAGAISVGAWMVALLLVSGLLLRIGGRRTPLGKLTAAQLRGLRRYLVTLDSAQVRQHLDTDPDYFFRMLPYAAALGVDKRFAKRFGGIRMPLCPYLTGSGSEGMSALQWCELLRKTVGAMEDRANKLPLEKFLGTIHGMIKR